MTTSLSPNVRVEDILRQAPPPPPPSSPSSLSYTSVLSSSPRLLGIANGTASLSQRQHNTNNSDGKRNVFDEVCQGCGVHVPIDDDGKGWKCSKYCAHCARETI
uniref:Prickle-like protein 1 n=1 Tax=Lygus hesperus TaxID=30085 RepID=A0A0A9X7W2_LYGHE